jgi:phage tail tape-measure protein
MTLPEDYPKWVLQILQTTIATEFNMAFAHLQRTIKVVDPMIKENLKVKYPAIDNMQRSAENMY